ncbi:hypothetical protein HXX76_014352 [Chlamydomonas incerta]|uniref:Flagellar associated protein n=1 Tax=Chlamydomonas incerta TaxID=51695 RepID=A0A835SC91_CHLIN|nr:hypothetical protein HXX76_014352 [Chlamydomonas incerta]|eukprot:KAG2424627.1 hypothetical protein HXX76_014352 [Chlamydomonas incerta]
MRTGLAPREGGPKPSPPRQGAIWWSAAPPLPSAPDEASASHASRISDAQLKDWLSCTAGWKALELSWGALQGCEITHEQLKVALQASMAEAARLGATRLVVRQLDVDEVLGRGLGLALAAWPCFGTLKLQELNLYDEAMAHLCGALHCAEHLRALVLDTVWASVGGWAALGAAIKVNTSLTSLRLRDCVSSQPEAAGALGPLCAALADQQGALAELVLARNPRLGEAGVAEVCKALIRSTAPPHGPALRPSRLAHLDLSHTGAGPGCVPGPGGLAVAVRAVRSLRHLDVSHNPLGPEAVRELCRALAAAPHVTSLRLDATGADDAAAEALARGPLMLNVSPAGACLSCLSLAHNRLTARGAAALAAAARRPGCSLTDVDLSYNAQVGEEGAKHWAAVLTSPGGRCRLRRLVLSGCEVSDDAAYALGGALKVNACLAELGLAENHISTRGVALLAEVLKSNTALRLLDLGLNVVGPVGMTPFTQQHQQQQQQPGAGDHAATRRAGGCLVKTEVLREYRDVEAVKHSEAPWEAERAEWAAARLQRQRQEEAAAAAAAANPFLEPDAGGGGGGGSNPFLSPAASYVNPFLDPPSAAAAAAGGVAAAAAAEGGAEAVRNPFLSPESSYVNPFLSPTKPGAGSGKHDNPFLSPAASSPTGGAGPGPGQAEGEAAPGGGGTAGRQLVTRVVTRLGGSGGSQDGDGGSQGGSGGSGTGVYVSSRSTADAADLVTDMDLLMVEYMLESMGLAPDAPHPDDQAEQQQQEGQLDGREGHEGQEGQEPAPAPAPQEHLASPPAAVLPAPAPLVQQPAPAPAPPPPPSAPDNPFAAADVPGAEAADSSATSVAAADNAFAAVDNPFFAGVPVHTAPVAPPAAAPPSAVLAPVPAPPAVSLPQSAPFTAAPPTSTGAQGSSSGGGMMGGDHGDGEGAGIDDEEEEFGAGAGGFRSLQQQQQQQQQAAAAGVQGWGATAYGSSGAAAGGGATAGVGAEGWGASNGHGAAGGDAAWGVSGAADGAGGGAAGGAAGVGAGPCSEHRGRPGGGLDSGVQVRGAVEAAEAAVAEAEAIGLEEAGGALAAEPVAVPEPLSTVHTGTPAAPAAAAAVDDPFAAYDVGAAAAATAADSYGYGSSISGAVPPLAPTASAPPEEEAARGVREADGALGGGGALSARAAAAELAAAFSAAADAANPAGAAPQEQEHQLPQASGLAVDELSAARAPVATPSGSVGATAGDSAAAPPVAEGATATAAAGGAAAAAVAAGLPLQPEAAEEEEDDLFFGLGIGRQASLVLDAAAAEQPQAPPVAAPSAVGADKEGGGRTADGATADQPSPQLVPAQLAQPVQPAPVEQEVAAAASDGGIIPDLDDLLGLSQLAPGLLPQDPDAADAAGAAVAAAAAYGDEGGSSQQQQQPTDAAAVEGAPAPVGGGLGDVDDFFGLGLVATSAAAAAPLAAVGPGPGAAGSLAEDPFLAFTDDLLGGLSSQPPPVATTQPPTTDDNPFLL